MRGIVILAVLLVAGPARAQPVGYEVGGEVSLGKKPGIKVTAAQDVTDLRLDLERNDGKKFVVQRPALARTRAVILDIGDGAAGKATYKGTLSAQVAGQPRWSVDLVFETLVRAPISVSYDAEHLDLDKHVLQFKLSRAAGSATLSVLGEDGKELGTGAATYKSEPANTWLSITWTQPAGARVLMLRLHAIAADGLATKVELIPWSVEIEHVDVNFALNSAVIDPGEAAKLDASVIKITEVVKRSERFVKMQLYVAGHTDTVGPSVKNRVLSLDRARAIAAYFRKHGIALPIAFAGFGEDVLRVKTADETDERANRRVDYVIGPAGGAPPFKGPYLKAKATWKPLP